MRFALPSGSLFSFPPRNGSVSIHTVVSTSVDPVEPVRLRKNEAPSLESDIEDPALRPCQTDCLKACAKGARIIEIACGTGKTRVIEELVRNISGRVPCLFMWGADEFGYVRVDFALRSKQLFGC